MRTRKVDGGIWCVRGSINRCRRTHKSEGGGGKRARRWAYDKGSTSLSLPDDLANGPALRLLYSGVSGIGISDYCCGILHARVLENFISYS